MKRVVTVLGLAVFLGSVLAIIVSAANYQPRQLHWAKGSIGAFTTTEEGGEQKHHTFIVTEMGVAKITRGYQRPVHPTGTWVKVWYFGDPGNPQRWVTYTEPDLIDWNKAED